MHNLRTIKSHSFQAHMARLQDTAEAMAELSAGEVLAGRVRSSYKLASIATTILETRTAMESHYQDIRHEVEEPSTIKSGTEFKVMVEQSDIIGRFPIQSRP